MTEFDSTAGWELAADQTSQLPSANSRRVIELFHELRSPLLRYLLGIGLRVQDGEEVAQEVFLALFQHLDRGRPEHNLRGWVFRTAHNLGLKRRAACAKEAADIPDRPDAASNPEEALLTREKSEHLEAILRALPEQDRWCLALRAEGLRYREIADVLDVSLGSVSASLARSLARLSRARQ